MNVARLNFSHGDHADHEASYLRVRRASNATGRAVGILADLQGPKIRLGRFAETQTVWATGETVRITVQDCEGSHDRVSTTYKQLAGDARPGDRLLVDDGKVALVVEHIDGDDVVCTVTEGGPVSNNKGLSMPGMAVSVPALSTKDIEDLEFALKLGVDMIASEGYGEIIGGAQREDDLGALEERIAGHELPRESFEWFLDLRRFGSVPHGGFGLGLERTLAWICGVDHLRECIPFPRMLHRIYP